MIFCCGILLGGDGDTLTGWLPLPYPGNLFEGEGLTLLIAAFC